MRKKYFWFIFFLITLLVGNSVMLGYASKFTWNNPISTSSQKHKLTQHQNETIASQEQHLIYRPISLTLDETPRMWQTKFPSQITIENIKKYLRLAPQSSVDGSATNDASGYSFQKIDERTQTSTPIAINDLKSNIGLNLGTIANTSLNNIQIQIVEANDDTGILTFRVYQQLQTYTLFNNGVIGFYSDAKELFSNNSHYQATILPPTKLGVKSAGKTDLWQLPSNYSLNKLFYNFNWTNSAIIINFIHNYNNIASSITKEIVENNFFHVTPNFTTSTTKLMPPKPTVKLEADNQRGRLIVTVTLTDQFLGQKIRTQTFFGFQTLTTVEAQLNIVPNDLLLLGIISDGLWDVYANPNDSKPTTSFIGERVSSLLPSQFLAINPSKKFAEYTLLDLFAGKPLVTLDIKDTEDSNEAAGEQEITESSNKQGPLKINTSSGISSEIAYLTLGGERPQEGSLAKLPNFQITKIDGVPNDVDGTLNLLIFFQTLDNVGALTNMPPAKITFKGFKTNADSGQPLLFSWNSNFPQDYASLSAREVADLFIAQSRNQITLGSFTNNDAVKQMVSRFFVSSDYVKTKFFEEYNRDTSKGAMVAINLVSDTEIESDTSNQGISLSIMFAQYGNQIDQVFTNSYLLSSSVSTIPKQFQSSLTINQEFNGMVHKFSHLLPTDLTQDNLLELFILTTPPGGQEFTTPLEEAIVFSVPDSRTGQILVSIIFPLFNKIENYEFSNLFSNFERNDLLDETLSLNHTALINLDSAFLAKNPLDDRSLTEQDILDNVFAAVNPRLFNLLSPDNIEITKRGKDFVEVMIYVNWTQLLQKSSSSASDVSASSNLQSYVVYQNDVQEGVGENTFKTEQENHQTTKTGIRFVIRGFLTSNVETIAQTPQIQGEIVPLYIILAIGFGITGVLLLVGFVTGTIFFVRMRKYGLAAKQGLVLALPKRKKKPKKVRG